MSAKPETPTGVDGSEKESFGGDGGSTQENITTIEAMYQPQVDCAPVEKQEQKKPIESEKTSTLKSWTLFAAVFFSAFLMALNGSVVATAVPKITSDFKSLEDIGWYGSAYLVSTCSLQPLAGSFYTRFPIKPTFIVFTSIFTFGSLICGTAVSSNMLIIGRAIQGVGGAGILNGAFITISTAAPKGNKPLLVGVGIGISTIGTVIGPLIGGVLTQHVSWRWCFYINLPPSALVIFIYFWLTIPEQIEKKPVWGNLKSILLEELDLIGFAIFAPACVMFLLALNWGGNRHPWNSKTVIGLFCGAFATFTVFIVWTIYKGDKAMIPPKAVRNRLVLFGCLTSFFQMGSMLALTFYLPLWFQVVKRASPTMSGVMIMPTIVSQAIGSVVAGKFVQLIGYCTPWAIFGSALTSIGAGLLTTFTVSSSTGQWIGYQVFGGIGRGSVIQMPVTAIQNLLPAKDVAIATSQVFFCQYLGGAIFLAAGQTIFTGSLRSSLERYAPNYDPQTIIDVGASAVSSVVSQADLPSVLRAYNHAITTAFYLAVGGSCITFLTSFGMGWQKIPGKEDKESKKRAVAA